MNKLKEYIKKKKADNTFKHLGKGYVLSGDQSSSQSGSTGQSDQPLPSDASADTQACAAAAVEKRWSENINRMTAAQKAVYLQTKRGHKEEQNLSAIQSDERVFSGESGQPADSDVQQEDDSILYFMESIIPVKRTEQFLRAVGKKIEEEMGCEVYMSNEQHISTLITLIDASLAEVIKIEQKLGEYEAILKKAYDDGYDD